MKSGLLKRTLSDLTSLALGTSADRVKTLQQAGMVTKGSRGRHGGVIMTSTDRINGLLACVFEPMGNESHSVTVTRIRRLRLALALYNPLTSKLSSKDNARSAFQVAEGLGLNFDDLGVALDGIVDCMRTGAFEKWKDSLPASVSVHFHGERRAMLVLEQPQVNISAIFDFTDGQAPAQMPIERSMRLNTEVFRRLAVDEPT
jgi:hypothetical protein